MCKKKILTIVMLLLVQQLAAQNRYSVVIDELMADPTPPVGLPAVEYIELKNVSGSNINLSGWRIADAGAQSGPLPAYILKPDSFLIVCSSSSLAQLLPFGPAVSVSGFPSLDNDGDIITLRSPSGMAIHTVAYTTAWYRNPAKAGGGWSLEMTDTRNPCGGAGNWKASTGALGGTPGKRNANYAPNPDTQPPSLTHTYTTGAGEVVA
ncbi:MAG: lamin tail domain-containing protein, partial [Dinghuibacter sp.]|nr:lamin tail domain-containing protein [Dinghuibacter sp.]